MNKNLLILGFICLLPISAIVSSSPASADDAQVLAFPPGSGGQPVLGTGSQNTSQTPYGGKRTQPMDGAGNDCSLGHPCPVTDASGAAFTRAATITPGAAPIAAGRTVEILCTVDGAVNFMMAGGGNHAISIAASPYTQTFPYSITGIDVSGTTATATYYTLY